MSTLLKNHGLGRESQTIFDFGYKEYGRPLQPEDSDAYKAMRLEALRTESRVFAASYQEEIRYSDAQWRELCTETNERCIIGIFDDENLVGVTTAMAWDEDATGETALFRSSYITPAYRSKDLSSLLCEARISWALQNPKFRAAAIFHREGHWIAKVVTNLGAKHFRTIPMQWANGETADALWYKMKIRP